jgi:hypothetical protein
MSRFLLSVSCAFLSLVLSCGHAKAENSASDSNEKKRLVWFVQTSIPKEIENPVKILTGTEIQMLTLFESVASQAVSVPEDGILRLVKEVPDPNPNAKGKINYITLAKAVVPKEVSRALVIMTPVKEPSKDGAVFLTKVQPLELFKGGDFMYINLSNSRIAIEIGTSKKMINSGGLEILSVAATKTAESVPYSYSYFENEKQRWMPLNASMTIASTMQREVFIFSPSLETGRIRCKGITFPVDP